tara:strand:- start:266 stop:475 length:210 start_codon:yes stop_codon:yes gene_type:complete
MIYTILFHKDDKVIASQETFASWDDAIGDIVAYGYTPHAILELQEDGKTQSCLGESLNCSIDQFKRESK